MGKTNDKSANYMDVLAAKEGTALATNQPVLELPLTELYPFENYPFVIHDDAAMKEMVEEIMKGQLVRPCVVRKRRQGGYEIIAGQREVRACELAERTTAPAVLQELDDDSATIAMVNANLPAEPPLHSEMAWALRMKLEALLHRGRKMAGIDPGKLSVQVLTEQTGKSKNQIYRYVHLTALVPALLDRVDAGSIAFSIAADYLYKLTRTEQAWLVGCMEKYEVTPSQPQALQMKRAHADGSLTEEYMDSVMATEKKETLRVMLSGHCLGRFFHGRYTPKQMETVILALLEGWLTEQQEALPLAM